MVNDKTIKMPQGLNCWTADEVAECLSGIGPDLYRKLWDILSAAKNPSPLGGDGSSGTVETPDGRLGLDNDDKADHWWSKLTPAEQTTIAASYAAEFYTGEQPA